MSLILIPLFIISLIAWITTLIRKYKHNNKNPILVGKFKLTSLKLGLCVFLLLLININIAFILIPLLYFIIYCCYKESTNPNRDTRPNINKNIYTPNKFDIVTRRKFDKLNAIHWAKQILRTRNIAILDTKTTTLDEDGYICDIAVIDLNKRILLNTLINPMTKIYAGSMHSIKQKDIKDKLLFSDIAIELANIFSKYYILIYNQKFDLGIIKNEIERMRSNIDENYKCIYNAYARLKSDCLMLKYAAYKNKLNEWNIENEHGLNYQWHKLNGGRRALTDVNKALVYLERIARG